MINPDYIKECYIVREVAKFLWVFGFYNRLTRHGFLLTTGSNCNMGTRDLPNMYVRSPRATGPRPEVYIYTAINSDINKVFLTSLCTYTLKYFLLEVTLL